MDVSCPHCQASIPANTVTCSLCNRPVDLDAAQAAVNEALERDRERFKSEEEARDESILVRIRSRRKSHAVTGFVIFFVMNFIMALPGSFHPITILLNLIVSAVFGLPIGYLISVMRGGMYRGMAISMGTFMLARIILGIPELIGGALFSEILTGALYLGFVGVIPGLIIGIHVEIDN